MKYKEGDTVYLKRDKAVISQLYKSTTGEEGYILAKNDDNNHLYFAKEDEVELIEPECISNIGKTSIGKTSGPTDNTTEKIKELKQLDISQLLIQYSMLLDMDFAEIGFASHEEYARCSIQVLAREMMKQIDKLNEVIRYINRRKQNE